MQHEIEPEDTREPGLLAKVLATTVLLVVIGCVLLQVFSRYSFHLRVSWTEELARFGLFAIAGVGGVVALLGRSHFRMTIIVDRFPPPLRFVAEAASLLIATGILATITWSGALYAVEMMDSTSPMLRISYFLPYAILPLATAVMTGWSGWRLFALLRDRRAGAAR